MSPLVNSTTADFITPCDDHHSSARSRISSKTEIDPKLQRLIDAWPTLPAALREGILAMIDAARKDK